MDNKRLYVFYKLWSRVYDSLIDRLFSFDRKQVLQHVTGKNIIELGVGTGLNLAHYPTRCVVTGIDISSSMLKWAKKKARKNTTLYQMDAAHMTRFKDNSFDGAVMTFLLRVVPEPRKVLQEVQRVVKNGGRIVIYDVFGEKSFWDVFRYIGWGKNYKLEELLSGLPFKVIQKGKLVLLENRKR